MIWSGLSRETMSALIEFALTSDPSPKAHHITRLAMYNALDGLLASQNELTNKAISISGAAGIARVLGLLKAKVTETTFPEHTILDLKFDNGEFDVAISDQVLEHVEGDPFQAIRESVRVVRQGGHVVHTTCFMNEIHGAPNDYWRFTPNALRLLVEKAGCEVLTSGGWGNREVWAYLDLGFRFRQIPRNPANPIYQLATRNEATFPIVTWVIGRKK